MVEVEKMRRIGVGKLIDILYRKEITEIIPEWYVKTGRLLHNKFGYYENLTLAKYHEHQNEKYLIIGSPDLIEDNGTIVEFKVAFSPRTVSYQKEKGETQANIYCWLGNFPYYQCDVYSYRENKLLYGERKPFDEQKAITSVNLALELLNEYTKYLARRKELLLENGWET